VKLLKGKRLQPDLRAVDHPSFCPVHSTAFRPASVLAEVVAGLNPSRDFCLVWRPHWGVQTEPLIELTCAVMSPHTTWVEDRHQGCGLSITTELCNADKKIVVK